MDIQIDVASSNSPKAVPTDMSNIVFGTCFTDHMFVMEWDQGQGWHDARIQPYQPLVLEPSALVFHYGQEAFEGMKAYHAADGRDVLFRPKQNFERLNVTADRMCLPQIDPDFAIHSLKQLLQKDRQWIPKDEGTSLYIRPTLIATEAALGLKVSAKYLYFVIMCPVGPYYPEGFNPVKILVEEDYIRSAPGGVGAVKTGGNYAASNYVEKKAKSLGFTQVMWLDGVERKYVEEVGSMNLFFVKGKQVITPELTGTILPGITRNSVLELGRHWGFDMIERRISIDEVIEGLKTGEITEIFGSGTAAVISPVGELCYREQLYPVNGGQTGPISQKFFDGISALQYGRAEDPFNWREYI